MPDMVPPNTEKKLTILLVGQAEREEFADAIAMLSRLGDTHVTPRLQAAIELVGQADLLPEVVVLLASRPSEFLDRDVNRLRAVVPLARLVTLLGSWCEGEMRTGVPLAGMVRLYWHEWEPVCQRELSLLKNGSASYFYGASTWSMPVTATDEERLLDNRPITFPRGKELVAIDSASPAMANWMAEACKKQGYSVVLGSGISYDKETFANVHGVDIVMVDAMECNAAEHARIDATQARWPSARMIVLLDFPRIEQRRQLERQGVAAVVSKPITLEALLWHLQQVFSAC